MTRDNFTAALKDFGDNKILEFFKAIMTQIK